LRFIRAAVQWFNGKRGRGRRGNVETRKCVDEGRRRSGPHFSTLEKGAGGIEIGLVGYRN